MNNGGMGHIGSGKQGGWVALAALGLSAASAAATWWGGQSAKSKAEDAAKENEKLIGLEGKEELRRMDRTQAFRMGEAKANLAAGNVRTSSGGVGNALDSMETEYQKQRGWQYNMMRHRQLAARKGAIGVGDTAKYQAGSQLASGVANWWTSKQKPIDVNAQTKFTGGVK